MSSRTQRPPTTTTSTATASARRESRIYDPHSAYYTDSQHHPPSSSRKTAKPTKSRDHHPPPAASSYYYSKNGYYSSYEQPTTAAAGIARAQSVAPSISSHRDYPTVPPARAPSVQPSLHHYSSHAQLPPERPPSTQPQQIARPPSRAAHGVTPSVSQSQSQSQAWAAYYAAGGTAPSTSYGAPSTSAAGAAQAPPPASSSRAPPTSANAYPSLFEGYANGIDGYAASSQNPPSTSYGNPYQNMTIPGKARSSRHRDLEKEYDPSPQSSNERVVWPQHAATAVDDQRDGRPGPPPSAPIPIPGVAGTARSTRHLERERDQPSTSYKQQQQGSYDPQAYGPSSSYVIPPQGIAVARSTRSVRERDAVPAGVAVAASSTRRRDKERERDRGDRTDAEDERREERRRNRDRERDRGEKTDAEDDRRRRDRDRGGYKTDVEDERRREERRRDRDREDKTDAEDDRRREERRRDRERSTRDRERETDTEDAYRRRKEREREERRRERERGDKDRERGAHTDAEDEATAVRRREERRREREEEKRRDEEKKRERERERQEREREDERRREERERIKQERIRIETEERERRRRIQAEADYRAQLEAQAASRAQAEAEEREKQRRAQTEARARAEADERERQRRLEQAEAEERERQRPALVEQERRAARAEAEERQRRLQAEAEERHRRMQAEAATQAREAEEHRRLQLEAQARAQAEAEARARAEAEAQAAHAREQERQRQLQAEVDAKERHRHAFLEQQRQAAAAQAEAEEKQRRFQVEAAARAHAEAQERERQERERQRRLQAQAEAEEKERERQAAALAKAEAEARQKRRQEEAEERERQRRIQAEAQARAETEERQRRLQAEAQAKAEAEEKERHRQAQARAEAEERERHRLAVLEHERKVAEDYQRRMQAEAEEQERQRQYQMKAAAEAQEREYHRRLQAEAEEKERQHRRQAEAEERERQRRHQAEAEERERQRRHQADLEERERQRRQQAEAEERERQRRHQAEAEERDRQRRLQAEAEEKERHRLIFLEQQRQAAIAKAEAEDRQRRLQEEAEVRERERARQAAEERQRRLQAESEEREQQRLRAETQTRTEAEDRERQRRLQAEADESERQRILAEEWTRKEKERLTANTKGSNDMLWGPPVPVKNGHPHVQSNSTSTHAMAPLTAETHTSQRQASSTAAPSSIAPLHQPHSQHLASHVPQDSPPLRVLGDSNRDRGLSGNSPKNRKRDSQHLNSSFPVVEKTGSGRYKDKTSRQSVVPTPSTQLQGTSATSNNLTQSHGPPTLAPARTQESIAQIHPPEQDITFVDSEREPNGAKDKRRASKLPENPNAPQASYQPFVSPDHEAAAIPSAAARLAALMTHTDSNLPYFQRKLSKDSLVVNPNTSGFLVPPVEFSQHRQPSKESIRDGSNPLDHLRQQPSSDLATPGPVRNSPSRPQHFTQQHEYNLHQHPPHERHASTAAVPVLPLHPPSILSQDVIQAVEPQTNMLSHGDPPHSSGRIFVSESRGEHGGNWEKERESDRERLMHQEREKQKFERERELEKERQLQLDQKREEREREAQRAMEEQKQVKGKKGKKETKKEKAQAKKREKEREKEDSALRPPSATGQAEFSGPANDDEDTVANSTIKARSASKHKALPDIWMPGRSSHDGRPGPQQQDTHEHEVPLPDPPQSAVEPVSATSTVKAKKDRRHRRKVSFGQDKTGQESGSEQEPPSGTWGKGSLRGLFRNPRNATEEAQVSSTDTDQDPETAKRHKRRTSSRLQEGFSAAVEASAKLASLLVPGRGDRSRKSSNHSIMVAHEPSFDEDPAVAIARHSQEQLPEPPSNIHQRTSSQDTNTIPFPQPTILGKGPIVSAPITAPLGDGPEFIVPRSPYRASTSLPSAQNNERVMLALNHPSASTNSNHEQIRTEDALRLAALIDVGEPPFIHSRSRNTSLVPTPGQPELVPGKSYFEPVAPHTRDVQRSAPSTTKPSLKPNTSAGTAHYEDYDKFHGERPAAATYVSSPAMYYGNTIARPPTLAPPEPERPTLPTSISYSSTTVEASSRTGPTVTQSSSSFSVPTLSHTSRPSASEPLINPLLQRPSVDGYMSNEPPQTQGSRSRQPSANNGDTSLIAQLLARVTGSKDSQQIITEQQPLSAEPSHAPSRDVNASNTLPTRGPTRNGDIEHAVPEISSLPLQVPENVVQNSSASRPSVYPTHHEASARGSKERVPRTEPAGERTVSARDAAPASTWVKPSLPMPIPTIPSYQTSSHHPESSRTQQPPPLSNSLPQQPAVTRAKHTSHSRQNSQDTLVDAPGSKSSPHQKPTPIAPTTKGSPLANRNGSQDTIVHPASFKPSSLQDTWTAQNSSQPTVHFSNTATTSPTTMATSNATTTSSKTSDQPSRPDTTSRNPNLLSEYPESRSHPIPSNTQPVSLLSATAPPSIETISKTGPFASYTAKTPKAAVQLDPEHSQPVSSSYATRPPNPHSHTPSLAHPTTIASAQERVAYIPAQVPLTSSRQPHPIPARAQDPERTPLAPVPTPALAVSSRPSNPPPSRAQDVQTSAIPNPSSHPRLPEKPAPNVPRTAPQAVPSSTTNQGLTSRSQEEVAPSALSPTPLSIPPVRSTQTASTGPTADRKASGTPYPASHPRVAPDLNAEPPAPATKSKVERSPPTQLRQHSDPSLDTKPEPPQPTEPTTRRVKPLRGVSDQGPHRVTNAGQTVTVQLTPDGARRERVRTKDRETTKKKGLFGLFRPRESSQHPIITPDKPMTDSNESLPESLHRLRLVESAPATMPPLVPIATVISRTEEKKEVDIVAPIPVHGNGKPLSKRHAPFRVTAKRYRTVSQASMDAADGNTVSMIMSGAESIRSSTAGRPSPPLRDPVLATMEWRNKEEAAHQDRGKRRRRPGVVFEVEDEQAEKQKQPAKVVRRGTRGGRLTKPPPESTGRGD